MFSFTTAFFSETYFSFMFFSAGVVKEHVGWPKRSFTWCLEGIHGTSRFYV